MAYGDFKELPRKTAFDKVLCDIGLILLEIPNYKDINADFCQWFISFW